MSSRRHKIRFELDNEPSSRSPRARRVRHVPFVCILLGSVGCSESADVTIFWVNSPSQVAFTETGPSSQDAEFSVDGSSRALAVHNSVRQQAGSALPPLVWSTQLADLAQQWANTVIGDCDELRVRHRPENEFGENLTAQSSFSSESQLDVNSVVEGWASEADCWTPGTFLQADACNIACIAERHSTSCGHYTQLVWRNTTSVGCGYASCVSGRALNEIWVCNYAPAGNIPGQIPY